VLEARREALDEWAVFTVHGTEEFNLETFHRVVSHLAALFAPKSSQLGLTTWVHSIMHQSQNEPGMLRQPPVVAGKLSLLRCVSLPARVQAK
jgi:hypothetical protein